MKFAVGAIAAFMFALCLAAGAYAEDQITGCLAGPNSEGAYDLKRKEAPQTVEVSGLADIAKHVGHTVTLTGEWVKSGANQPHFKATAIQHLSAECP
jgi:hypothetical protein